MAKILMIIMAFISLSNAAINRMSLMKWRSREIMCSNLLNLNNFFYVEEEIKNISGIPADMSFHWKGNRLFFTLINDEMRMSLQIVQSFEEIDTIKVAGLGQSSAVDNMNDIVYLATDNGVYKLKEDNSAELYTALGEDVMYVTVSSDGTIMYIATWPQNRVQKITNDGKKFESFSAIPNGHGLTVDVNNNMYFVATKTSYLLRVGTTVPVKIKGLPTDKMTGVFVSRSDEVFAMDEDSNLYVIDPKNDRATHLGTFSRNGVNTFAMDASDNIYIGIKDAIIKYKAFESNPCEVKVKKRHSKGHKRAKTTTTTEWYDYEEEDEEN